MSFNAIHPFRKIGFVSAIWILFLVSACGGGSDPVRDSRDTPNSGSINISVDEAFKPVIDSQIKVFESQFPNAKINVQYKPEAECLKDLNNDSIRMVIVTRALSRAEEATLKDSLEYKPAFGPIALDAIAVIVNNRSKDTIFTMDEIVAMVKNNSSFKYKVLLDGTSATSNVRYVMDSLLQGQPLTPNVVAANSSEGVIDYVSKNTDAIGLVGVSWVGNKEDPQVLTFLESVKIAAIECKGCSGTYVKPYQANIATFRYPMIRPLFYILKENYNGLGSGFRNFLIYEKGQLIFQRAYLLPSRMQFQVREMQISE